jgi:hypothetical protein
VIGGIGFERLMLNSIEKLSLTDLARGDTEWQLFEISIDYFYPLFFSVVVPINSEEIAILGGHINARDASNEIFIFNTKTDKLTQV